MDDLELKAGEPRELFLEIRALIEEARRQTAVAVNMGLTAPPPQRVQAYISD
jgi:hypothetical protein